MIRIDETSSISKSFFMLLDAVCISARYRLDFVGLPEDRRENGGTRAQVRPVAGQLDSACTFGGVFGQLPSLA